jgi:hypothetical protein
VRPVTQPCCPPGNIPRLVDTPRNLSTGCPAASLVDNKARISFAQQEFCPTQHVVPIPQASVDQQYGTASRVLGSEKPASQHDPIRRTDRHVFPGSAIFAGNCFGTIPVTPSQSAWGDEVCIHGQRPRRQQNGYRQTNGNPFRKGRHFWFGRRQGPPCSRQREAFFSAPANVSAFLPPNRSEREGQDNEKRN